MDTFMVIAISHGGGLANICRFVDLDTHSYTPFDLLKSVRWFARYRGSKNREPQIVFPDSNKHFYGNYYFPWGRVGKYMSICRSGHALLHTIRLIEIRKLVCKI